ncbi:AbfB domain-containing protein [Peribacillus butanolivorans]|uniref:AbfB domain-containing protein n=1 Tax=Peribacillus butanolivorans TaxID=421767 RepID=UPI0035E12F15
MICYGFEFISFRSMNFPDRYIRHRDFHLYADFIPQNDQLALKDSTFRITNPAIRWPQ